MKKEYMLMWLSEDGSQMFLGTVFTSNPKDALFNEICRMIVVAPYYFKTEENVNIRKRIKAGDSRREHYFAEINGQVLSIMEANFHQTPDNE